MWCSPRWPVLPSASTVCGLFLAKHKHIHFISFIPGVLRYNTNQKDDRRAPPKTERKRLHPTLDLCDTQLLGLLSGVTVRSPNRLQIHFLLRLNSQGVISRILSLMP